MEATDRGWVAMAPAPGCTRLAYDPLLGCWLLLRPGEDDVALTIVDPLKAPANPVLAQTAVLTATSDAQLGPSESVQAAVAAVRVALATKQRDITHATQPASTSDDTKPCHVLPLPSHSQLLLVHGSELKLIAASNGVYPLNGLFQHECNDDSELVSLELQLVGFAHLLVEVNWDEVVAASSDEGSLFMEFFDAVRFKQSTSLSWQTAIVRCSAKACAAVLSGALQWLLEHERAEDLKFIASCQLVINALERLRALCPQVERPAKVDKFALEAERLQSFVEWKLASPSLTELAEAGFAHKPSLSHRHRVQHFAAKGDREACFSCFERAEFSAERYMRRAVDRGLGPNGNHLNVPLAASMSAQPPQTCSGATSDAVDGGSVVFVSRCASSDRVVACSCSGTVSLWASWPNLSRLHEFSSFSDLFGDGFAVAGAHLRSRPAPLSPCHVVVVVNVAVPACSPPVVRHWRLDQGLDKVAEQIHANSKVFYRCRFCDEADTVVLVDPEAVRRHVSHCHREVASFPQYTDLQEPTSVGHWSPPLTRVLATSLMPIHSDCSRLVLFGHNEQGQATVAWADLQHSDSDSDISAECAADQPEWHTCEVPIVAAEAGADGTAGAEANHARMVLLRDDNALADAPHQDDQRVALLSQSGKQVFLVDTATATVVLAPSPIADIKESSEEELGQVEKEAVCVDLAFDSSLGLLRCLMSDGTTAGLDVSHTFTSSATTPEDAATAPTATSSAATPAIGTDSEPELSDAVLQATKACTTTVRVKVTSVSASHPCRSMLMHPGQDQIKRPSVIVWPLLSSDTNPLGTAATHSCYARACGGEKCYSAACRKRQQAPVFRPQTMIQSSKESVAVHADADVDSPKTTEIHFGQAVRVIGSRPGWMQVQSLGGASTEFEAGWINVPEPGSDQPNPLLPLHGLQAQDQVSPLHTSPDNMALWLWMQGQQYISSIRVECDFDAATLRSLGKSAQCLVALSFLDVGSVPRTVSGHTFNLLAQSSKKDCGRFVRYKATIRSSPLSMSATSRVRLSFSHFDAKEGTVQPLAVRLSLFGSPAHHQGAVGVAPLSRRLLLDASQFDKANARMLAELALPVAPHQSLERVDAIVSVLMFVLVNAKSAASSFAARLNLPEVLMNQLCRFGQPCDPPALSLLDKFADMSSKCRGLLLRACLHVLPQVAASCSNAHVLDDYFRLLEKCSKHEETRAIGSLLQQFFSLSREAADELYDWRYLVLRQHLRLHELVFEPICFARPTDIRPTVMQPTPRTITSFVLPSGDALPLKFALVHKSTGELEAADQDESPQPFLLAKSTLVTLQLPAEEVLLELPTASIITDVVLQWDPSNECKAANVQVCLVDDDAANPVLLSSKLTPTDKSSLFHTRTQRSGLLAAKCLRLSACCATDDGLPQASFANEETPPNGVGLVTTNVTADGKLVVTPISKLMAHPHAPSTPKSATPAAMAGSPYTPAQAQAPGGRSAAAAKPCLKLRVGVFGYPSNPDEAAMQHEVTRAQAVLDKLQSAQDALEGKMQHFQSNPTSVSGFDKLDAQDEYAQCLQRLADSRGALQGVWACAAADELPWQLACANSNASRCQAVLRKITASISGLATSRKMTMQNLDFVWQAFHNATVYEDDTLFDQTLQAIAKSLKLSPEDWADFIVKTGQHCFKADAAINKDTLLTRLKTVAKNQELVKPSLQSPLLQRLFAQLFASDSSADGAALDSMAVEYLLTIVAEGFATTLPDLSAAWIMPSYVTVLVVNPTKQTTVHFKLKRSTPLRKLMQAYCDVRAADPTCIRFKLEDKELQPSMCLDDLGVSAAGGLTFTVVETPKPKPQPNFGLPADPYASLGFSALQTSADLGDMDSFAEPDVSESKETQAPQDLAEDNACIAVHDGTDADDVEVTAAASRPRCKPTWYRVTSALAGGSPVHDAPSTEAPLLGVLRIGQRVLALDRDEDWLRIDFEGNATSAWTRMQENLTLYLTQDEGHPVHGITVSVTLRALPEVAEAAEAAMMAYRRAPLGLLLLQFCETFNLCPASVCLTFDGATVPGFKTARDLSLDNNTILSVAPRPSAGTLVDGEHITLCLRLPESGPVLVKAKRTASIEHVVQATCQSNGLDPEQISLALKGEQLTASQRLDELALADMEEIEVITSATGDAAGDGVQALSSTHMLGRLFGFMTSEQLRRPINRTVLVLMCTLVQRVLPSAELGDILDVLRQPGLEAFLDAISQTTDADLHAAVRAVFISLAEQATCRSLAEIECSQATVVAPGPLHHFHATVRRLIQSALADPCCFVVASYGDQLPFFLELLLAKSGVATTVSVDFHVHRLRLTTQIGRGNWICDSCEQRFSQSVVTERYRCTKGCDFDVCGACLALSVGDIATELLEPSHVLQLARLVAQRRPHSTRATLEEGRLCSLVFGLARCTAPEVLAHAPELWDMLSTVIEADIAVVTTQMRALFNQMLDNPLTAEPVRRRILDLVLRHVPKLRSEEPKLLVALLGCLADSTALCPESLWSADDLKSLLHIVLLLVEGHAKGSRPMSSWKGSLVVLLCEFVAEGLAGLPQPTGALFERELCVLASLLSRDCLGNASSAVASVSSAGPSFRRKKLTCPKCNVYFPSFSEKFKHHCTTVHLPSSMSVGGITVTTAPKYYDAWAAVDLAAGAMGTKFSGLIAAHAAGKGVSAASDATPHTSNGLASRHVSTADLESGRADVQVVVEGTLIQTVIAAVRHTSAHGAVLRTLCREMQLRDVTKKGTASSVPLRLLCCGVLADLRDDARLPIAESLPAAIWSDLLQCVQAWLHTAAGNVGVGGLRREPVAAKLTFSDQQHTIAVGAGSLEAAEPALVILQHVLGAPSSNRISSSAAQQLVVQLFALLPAYARTTTAVLMQCAELDNHANHTLVLEQCLDMPMSTDKGRVLLSLIEQTPVEHMGSWFTRLATFVAMHNQTTPATLVAYVECLNLLLTRCPPEQPSDDDLGLLVDMCLSVLSLCTLPTSFKAQSMDMLSAWSTPTFSFNDGLGLGDGQAAPAKSLSSSAKRTSHGSAYNSVGAYGMASTPAAASTGAAAVSSAGSFGEALKQPSDFVSTAHYASYLRTHLRLGTRISAHASIQLSGGVTIAQGATGTFISHRHGVAWDDLDGAIVQTPISSVAVVPLAKDDFDLEAEVDTSVTEYEYKYRLPSSLTARDLVGEDVKVSSDYANLRLVWVRVHKLTRPDRVYVVHRQCLRVFKRAEPEQRSSPRTVFAFIRNLVESPGVDGQRLVHHLAQSARVMDADAADVLGVVTKTESCAFWLLGLLTATSQITFACLNSDGLLDSFITLFKQACAEQESPTSEQAAATRRESVAQFVGLASSRKEVLMAVVDKVSSLEVARLACSDKPDVLTALTCFWANHVRHDAAAARDIVRSVPQHKLFAWPLSRLLSLQDAPVTVQINRDAGVAPTTLPEVRLEWLPSLPEQWLAPTHAITVQLPGSLALADAQQLLFPCRAAASRQVHVDLDSLVISDKRFSIGSHIRFDSRRGTLEGIIVAVLSKEIWVVPQAPGWHAVRVVCVSLATLQRGAWELQDDQRDATKHASTTLSQVAAAHKTDSDAAVLNCVRIVDDLCLVPVPAEDGSEFGLSLTQEEQPQQQASKMSFLTELTLAGGLGRVFDAALEVPEMDEESRVECDLCGQAVDDVLSHLRACVRGCGRLVDQLQGYARTGFSAQVQNVATTGPLPCGHVVPARLLVLCDECHQEAKAKKACADETRGNWKPLMHRLQQISAFQAPELVQTFYCFTHVPEFVETAASLFSCFEPLFEALGYPSCADSTEDAVWKGLIDAMVRVLSSASPSNNAAHVALLQRGGLQAVFSLLSSVSGVPPVQEASQDEASDDRTQAALLKSTTRFVVKRAEVMEHRNVFKLLPLTQGIYVNHPDGAVIVPGTGMPPGMGPGATYPPSYGLPEPMVLTTSSSAGAPGGWTTVSAVDEPYDPMDLEEMFAPHEYYAPHPHGQPEFACISIPQPITKSDGGDVFYFEVDILDGGHENMIAVGLNPSTTVSGMVGWENGSFGFHADDGTLRSETASQRPVTKNKATTGDVVGCGWVKSKNLVFFTRNGSVIGGFEVPGLNGPFYPVVTGADLAKIRIQFNERSWKFQGSADVGADSIPNLIRKRGNASRRGVGYARHSSTGKGWDVDSYEAQKREVNQRVCGLLGLLQRFLLKWHPPSDKLQTECAEQFSNSCLLPLLRSYLQNDSFTDMCKQAELYKQLCQLVLALCTHPKFAATFAAAMSQELSSLNLLAASYLKFHRMDDSGDDAGVDTSDLDAASSLAKGIIETASAVEAVLASSTQSQQDETKPASPSLPSSQNASEYAQLLGSKRVGCMEVVKSAGHHYYEVASAAPPSRQAMVRLAQEMADFASSLPCEPTNSVFVRCDAQRADLLRILITGVEGTPYSGGCFEFDLYCPPDYPMVAPKVNLETTGNGAVRFNPNLYNNGKVCLSLLGTWSGQGGETWSPSSTLLQVFASIQSLIMVEDVYFNEPGYESALGTKEGERLNQAYCNIVKYANVKYAMVEQLRRPSPVFGNVIRNHFFCKREAILAQCEQWLEEAQSESATTAHYSGLVRSHNAPLCAQFSSEPLAYFKALRSVVSELKELLSAITEPVPDESDDSSSDDDSDDSDSD